MTTTDRTLSIAHSRFDGLAALSWSLRGAAVLAGVVVAGWLFRQSGVHIHPHWPNLALLAPQPFAIKFHLATILAAFAIGCVLMAGVKGDSLHRALGWAWVTLMVTSAASSFFIHAINPHGLSFIHALSAWVVVAAPFGLYLARRHQVHAHRRMMTGLFLFGLGVSSAFTFLPGRLMFQIFFG
jgi:uncharacterized membrane protein